MNNIALLLLRIVFCGAMIYGHGISKLTKLLDGNWTFSNPIGIGEVPSNNLGRAIICVGVPFVEIVRT